MTVRYSHNLLGKTELHIDGIALAGADLGTIARAVAGALSLDEKRVLVTDVQPGRITLDILARDVDASKIAGRKKKLLDALSDIQSVTVAPGASVRADGMLGWIAADEKGTGKALARAGCRAGEIAARIRKRAVVFSTGPEVAGGAVSDTNMPFIADALERRGFTVTRGGVVGDDDEVLIAGIVRRAIESGGYGLVVTTGGVGAEEKDRTVEAVLQLDTGAATPYICRYEKGTGRHAKDGVRIAVGEYGGAVIAALPGPTDEVRISLDALLNALAQSPDTSAAAESAARALRAHLRER